MAGAPANPSRPSLVDPVETTTPSIVELRPVDQPTSASVAVEGILHEARLHALNLCDADVLPYAPESFVMIFRLRGRGMSVIVAPLMGLLLWGCLWVLLLDILQLSSVRNDLLPMEDVVTPLLTPVSFLLVFRLQRAAVRFWDARAAAGKLVEKCRVLVSTAAVSCERELELQADLARWTCVFPIAVKNFLRPPERRGWVRSRHECNRRLEVGSLLGEVSA